jgi:APA family basic amino acid/polyamine antiporter
MADLKKELSYRAILLITINSILGTGIFFLPAVGAAHSGPASILSWVIMAVIAIYTGMCFAELASMFPKAGGIYEFCKQAFGRFPSFLIGWTTIIAGNITIAMLVVGAIQYIFPANFPLVTIPLSLLFVFVFNYIAYRGMKTSAFMLITFAFITLITLFLLIIPGIMKFNPDNLKPFFTFPVSAIFVTIFFIAETFFGWETATFLAEETKDGQKIMPKALITGTVIIAAIAVLFVVTSLGTIPWAEFIGEYVVTLLVYLAIIGSVAGWIVAAPRLLLAMSRDELFPKQLAAIHPKHNTPYKAIIFQTVLTTVLVFMGVGSYNTLLHLLVPIVLILYSAVLISLVVMRYTKKDVKRYYTVPGGKVVPWFIIAFLIALIVGWWMEQHNALQLTMLGLSFILLGVPIYFLLEMFYDRRAIRHVEDFLARFTLMFENINLPTKHRKELLRLIGNVKGKSIYEYGAGVGTLTLHLAQRVGKKGKIFATGISKKELSILQNRLDKKGHKHVQVLHDPKHTDRAHTKVKKVDLVVSVGGMGYVKKPKTVLKHFAQRLKKGGRVVFLDYDKFFYLIPNIEWLNQDVKTIFKQAGFDVKVEKKRGLLWTYVYMYGTKK